MSFAENLKNLRKEKNLTQENLASEILVSRTLITKYESGAVLPTEENLKRLADYFAVTTSELMPDEEKNCCSSQNFFKAVVDIADCFCSHNFFNFRIIACLACFFLRSLYRR